ncbi:GTP 3',8-cyclase MoaA [Halioxenophilus aromaticivorans]|uniref:GTP 3',8-cyclase n=1 Tax=Halioxenophilus aromaticivorans TaxID=1306992 RepID=A0AAV3U9V4_9ALTE
MSTNAAQPLTDPFGRKITYLRLSVTDRCDFRCVYCMAEEMTFLPRAQLCTLEELAEIGAAFCELGVTQIRLTGGEPLIRRNVQSLFHQLGALPSLKDLTLTTNGSHLAQYADELKKAGVKRINVSLDTLQQERFKALSRTGDLQQVLAGLEAAKSQGFSAIKLNAVILRNRNFDEVVDLVEYAHRNQFDISFIEEMPLGHISEHGRGEEFVSSEDILNCLKQHFAIQPSGYSTGGPSRYWQLAEGQTRVGFISPHSNNFCGDCNRVRVSAEGKLLLCLGNEHSVDLKAVIRAHPGDREKLKQAIVDAIGIKPERHHFEHDDVQIVRFMNTTGG